MRQFATDSFDDAILAIVQRNNQLSNAAIGVAANLSASSVRRRLKAMRDNNIIVADVAVLNLARRGLSFVVQVFFEREDPQAVADFIAQMKADTNVSQCFSVSGDCDFWLLVHAQTPEIFEEWGQSSLMAKSSIRRYSTSLVWSQPVFSPSYQPS